MGCASSKRVEATAAENVYRPGPTSIALFDISTIEEPWLISTVHQQQQSAKTTNVPAPILEKLETLEVAPKSWSEVSKVLEDLQKKKPNTLQVEEEDAAADDEKPKPLAHVIPAAKQPKPPSKSVSFHTLEELDAQLSKPPNKEENKNADSKPSQASEQLVKKLRRTQAAGIRPDFEGLKPLRENSFILRDRMKREGTENQEQERLGGRRRRDPLSEFPEKCPPGGANTVVLYTTTLRGVRRTFEDCQRARTAVEAHRVAVDERDVALHGEFLGELRELLGEGVAVPRLFLKGRYVGGVDDVVEMNESGRLGELFDWAGVGRALGKRWCEGCGTSRFVPCLKCSGSCKVVVGEKGKEETVRCDSCNENGLVRCPLCHSL